MSAGLFSAAGIAGPDELPGYRLIRLEVLNWGTFDRRVWTLDVDGRNALLTGDIGSGKSTLVDAVTTLLLPSNRISYNKAAGADTRERDLRSYVRGHYKTARDEVHGSSKPVALRDGDTYSVILGVFANRAADREFTLAQVFWARSGQPGQPDRFFVTAETGLCIADDFADFGSQIVPLKRRLRERGAQVFEHFPEYGRTFRRALGIPSDQALELFHQTVSMKAVGDLNEFVRNHMLEPFDPKPQIDGIIEHFDDLNKAHEAVLSAKAKMAELDPLLSDGDAYERFCAERVQMQELRDFVPAYFAHHRVRLLTERLTRRAEEIGALEVRDREARGRVHDLRTRRDDLTTQRARLGGDRLGAIERERDVAQEARGSSRDRAARYNDGLADVGMRAVDDATAFAARVREIADADAATRDELASHRKVLVDLETDRRAVREESESVGQEIRSLQTRTSAIPRHSLELRDTICSELDLGTDLVPFVGELITVRDDSLEWEGAAERLLRPFALSLLVPEEHYAAVAAWVNDRHLGRRVVYYRVPERVPDGSDRRAGAGTLFGKLAIKPGPYFGWLEHELARRADLVCVETIEQFRRERRALTREGQIKGGQGRHEKDDRFAIGDRSRYVLGWSNQRKIDAVLEVAQRLQQRDAELETFARDAEEPEAALQERRRAYTALQQTRDFADLDWQRYDRQIAELDCERSEIETTSDELQRITSALQAIEQEVAAADDTQRRVGGDLAVARTQHEETRTALERAEHAATAIGVAAEDALGGELAGRLDAHRPTQVEDCDAGQHHAYRACSESIEASGREENNARRRAEAKMQGFAQRHPVETRELDTTVDSLAEYRRMRDRIAGDDLPRFEQEFKEFLNTNTIRDIASFQTELTKQSELIRDRIAKINDSLFDIDYNRDRYIRVEYDLTPNREIQEFRADLRACTAGTVATDESDQYSEEKFLEVKRLVQRFKGRDGFAEVDRRWTRLVTDVRNWLTFSGSERWRDSDEEYEHYTDSGGKSGGQKEKLAYTILAASLAYQFRLEWGVATSHNFQFVVIDEAFGRGSDDSTRFALGLFERLGLQLLIVTPLQKIQVIEPHVSTVGLVDNVNDDESRLQVLTVEEYAERRRRRALHALVEGDGAQTRSPE